MYRPKFVPQWNDPTTTLDWFNCTMASGAMALDFDTLGHVQVLGGQLRAVSGDNSGGTGLGSPGLTQAWAHYGQILHVGTGSPWVDVVAALLGSRGVVLQGMYGALPKAYHSPLNSFTFTGPHAVYLNPESTVLADVRNWLMGDPLNDKFIWVPEPALKSYAESLGVHEYGTASKLFFASSDAHVAVAPAPTRIPYAHTVASTTDGLNVRTGPTTTAAIVGSQAKSSRFTTNLLERNGGRYVVNGAVRTDWLGYMRSGAQVWVARAYTTVIA